MDVIISRTCCCKFIQYVYTHAVIVSDLFVRWSRNEGFSSLICVRLVHTLVHLYYAFFNIDALVCSYLSNETRTFNSSDRGFSEQVWACDVECISVPVESSKTIIKGSLHLFLFPLCRCCNEFIPAKNLPPSLRWISALGAVKILEINLLWGSSKNRETFIEVALLEFPFSWLSSRFFVERTDQNKWKSKVFNKVLSFCSIADWLKKWLPYVHSFSAYF